jgi:hypothetical protein
MNQGNAERFRKVVPYRRSVDGLWRSVRALRTPGRASCKGTGNAANLAGNAIEVQFGLALPFEAENGIRQVRESARERCFSPGHQNRNDHGAT